MFLPMVYDLSPGTEAGSCLWRLGLRRRSIFDIVDLSSSHAAPGSGAGLPVGAGCPAAGPAAVSDLCRLGAAPVSGLRLAWGPSVDRASSPPVPPPTESPIAFMSFAA